MKEIQRLVEEFNVRRGWCRFHTPQALLVALTSELGELARCFQFERPPAPIEDVRLELADLGIYLTCLANRLGVDLDAAIRDKIHINEGRFPVIDQPAGYPSGGTIEVVGLSGSGKSTLARGIAEALSLSFIDFADELVDLARDSDHDGILGWDAAVLDDRVHLVQERLATKVASGETFVLETHLCPNIPGEGYRPTTPTALARRRPRGIILLQTSYSDLLALRSKRDHKRDRNPPPERQFQTDSLATLAAAMSLASSLGIPCFICHNEVGALEASVRACVDVAKKFLEVEDSRIPR